MRMDADWQSNSRDDLSYVLARVVDAAGRQVADFEDVQVDFGVTGPAGVVDILVSLSSQTVSCALRSCALYMWGSDVRGQAARRDACAGSRRCRLRHHRLLATGTKRTFRRSRNKRRGRGVDS